MSELDHLAQQLPPTWICTALGDVVDYGRTSKAEPEEIDAASWVLELEDIEKDSSNLLQRLSFGERQSKSTKNRFEAGDVLYGKLRPYLNKVLIADQPGFCTTEIVPIKCAAHLDRRYLFYWLKHPAFLRYVEAASHGMNMPRLGTDAGRAAPFVLAPRPEQTRIADQLDTLLARIKACNDRLDAIPGLLKRFRQAAVSAAMAGQLTEEWPGAVPAPAWGIDELHALCEQHRVITYGVVKLGDETPGGTPCLRTSNVRWLKFETDGMKTIAPELSAQYGRTVLKGGEVLVNVRGTLGGVAVAESKMNGWNVSREVAVVPVDSRRINPQFAAYWIASAESQRWLARMEKGVAYVGINIEDLRRLPVRYPSRAEQDEIVRRLGDLLLLADQIERRSAKVTERSNRLTPQVLSKAFRGELLPQDPNDEPASVLLARLAAERSQAIAASKARQARTPRGARAPRSTLTPSKSMPTKSRQDEDVKGKPYLAGHLRRLGQPVDAKTLYEASELPVADFYKQLAWEIAEGHVNDADPLLEPARHAA